MTSFSLHKGFGQISYFWLFNISSFPFLKKTIVFIKNVAFSFEVNIRFMNQFCFSLDSKQELELIANQQSQNDHKCQCLPALTLCFSFHKLVLQFLKLFKNSLDLKAELNLKSLSKLTVDTFIWFNSYKLLMILRENVSI